MSNFFKETRYLLQHGQWQEHTPKGVRGVVLFPGDELPLLLASFALLMAALFLRFARCCASHSDLMSQGHERRPSYTVTVMGVDVVDNTQAVAG